MTKSVSFPTRLIPDVRFRLGVQQNRLGLSFLAQKCKNLPTNFLCVVVWVSLSFLFGPGIVFFGQHFRIILFYSLVRCGKSNCLFSE